MAESEARAAVAICSGARAAIPKGNGALFNCPVTALSTWHSLAAVPALKLDYSQPSLPDKAAQILAAQPSGRGKVKTLVPTPIYGTT